MSADFEIRGANRFLAVSKACKAVDKDLRKELNRAVKAAAKPLIGATREAAARDLPQRGGLAKRMAKAPQVIRTKTGADAGVSVVMPGKQAGYNDGVIRHPVFAAKYKVPAGATTAKGKKKTKAIYANSAARDGVTWVTQKVDGDWFDGTIRAGAKFVLPEISQAIENVAQQIVRKVERGA